MDWDSDTRQELDEKQPANFPKLVIRNISKTCNPVPIQERPPSRCGSIPVAPTMENDNPFDDITEEKLRQISGKQDLNRVTNLQITVDTHKQSIEALGELLPSLTQLRFHQSILHSFRDLGTSLHGLQILWLTDSGVKDLDGIGALTGLRELYLQNNEVSDISPLSMHDELHIIDLQGNCVEDIVQIEQLGLCPELTSLILESNPVANIPHYRSIVCNYIAHLKRLDQLDITDADRTHITPDMIDQALAFKQPTNSLKRNDSAMKSTKHLEASFSASSFESLIESSKERDVHSSELTHGTDVVFAGNVTSALRRRSHEHFHSDFEEAINRPSTPVSYPPRPTTPLNRESITDTLDRASELDLSCRLSSKSRDSIMSELKTWKMENSFATMIPKSRPDSSRPHSSAGGSRKEAFVETEQVSRKQSKTGKPHPVEILVLDDADEEITPAHRQWNMNLEILSPRIEIEPKQSSRPFGMQSNEDDDSSSDSDTERRLNRPKNARVGMFNVGDSLDAIEEWTKQITNSEDDDGPLVIVPVHDRCRTPRSKPPKTPNKSTSRKNSPMKQLNDETKCSKQIENILKSNKVRDSIQENDIINSIKIENTFNSFGDDELIMVLQGKDKKYLRHLKTKESFRSFFHGISSTRLEHLLRCAYGDGEKMQRRYQLMEGRMEII